MKIPSRTTAVPMTFLHQGRQYLGICHGCRREHLTGGAGVTQKRWARDQHRQGSAIEPLIAARPREKQSGVSRPSSIMAMGGA